MSDNLTALIARVQAALMDSGTLFTSAACTAAIRQALAELNARAPLNAGTLLDVIPAQKEYVLGSPDFSGLLNVLGVWLQGANENDLRLRMDAYREDNVPVVRLREPPGSGTLIVRYTLPHTVSGLDGAVESTLAPDQEQVLVMGACAYSAALRLVSRVETINLAPGVVEHYARASESFRAAFEKGLARLASARAPVGEPPAWAWRDEWEGLL